MSDYVTTCPECGRDNATCADATFVLCSCGNRYRVNPERYFGGGPRPNAVEEANALAATYRELNELSDVVAKLARVFDLPPVALASTVAVADEGTLIRLLHQRLTEIRARDGL